MSVYSITPTQRYYVFPSRSGWRARRVVTMARLSQALEPLLLKDIQETGQVIGKGAFGSVKKVRLWGMVCAAKSLHDLSLSGSKEEQALFEKFERECLMLSTLRHPFIVQFLGIYVEKKTLSPILVMEYLPTSLSACLKSHPRIPRYLQISMLHNVALALCYLHGHSPPILHRDLTANNVLLTTNMHAKIADLGVARMLDDSRRMRSQLTQAPGTAAYMPPEALAPNPQYTTKIDSFSFGSLLLHLVSQQWPLPSEPTQVVRGKLVPVSEPERRQQYLDLIGKEHCLMPLAVQCLQNDPGLRPEAVETAGILESLQSSNPIPTASHLDLLQVLESNRNQIESKGVQLAANKEQLQTVCLQLEGRDEEIQGLQGRIAETEKQIASSLKGMLADNASNGPPSPSPCTPHSSKGRTASTLHPTQSAFTWKRDSDLCIGTYGARGVVIDEKLYIGGGDCKDLESERVVHEYDCNGLVRKWTALPPAPVAYFALAEVNKTLTLVGGLDVAKKTATNHLTVWDRGQQEWCTPFPAMPTSRQDCTAISYKLQLLVAGGSNYKKPLYNVEVLDYSRFQWHHLSPLPQPCVRMTSCVVNSRWYLMGGINFTNPSQGESGPQTHVFSLDLSGDLAKSRWSLVPNTPLYCATAVPFGKYLMAVGGVDTPFSQAQSGAIYMYSAAPEKWLLIGSLPTPRSQTTAVVLAKSRLILLGGQEKKEKYGQTVEILQC